LIYKRKPRAPFVNVEFADGTKEQVWCTFDEEQIDLDVRTKTTKDFIRAEGLIPLPLGCMKGIKPRLRYL
jgi:sucrose phosphorylase